MKGKISLLLIIVIIFASAVMLTGCGGGNEEGPVNPAETIINVGATEVPHGEILEEAKGILEDEGYTLNIKLYGDYEGMNRGVLEGTLDANFFQTITYLNEYNLINETNLVNAGAIHFEPLAMYSDTLKDISDLKEGMTIAIPSEATNEARALRLLENSGIIKLREDVGVLATTDDVAENKLNIKLLEVEGYETAGMVEDADASIVNGNFAIKADLDYEEALIVEETESVAVEAYANVLAVREGEEASPKIEALYNALTSEKIRTYIEEEFDGAVVPLF